MLDALDQIDALEAAVAEYGRRSGRKPAALAELGPAGLLRVPPQDATGVPFAYDPTSGRVTIARTSMLWRPQVGRPAPKPTSGSAPAPAHPGS
jgi:hypothetical protein